MAAKWARPVSYKPRQRQRSSGHDALLKKKGGRGLSFIQVAAYRDLDQTLEHVGFDFEQLRHPLQRIGVLAERNNKCY